MQFEQEEQKVFATMLFPEAERVIYKSNPLHQVICQLRFPPILRIDSENPSAFQECIRHTFPEFRVLYDDAQDSLPESLSEGLPPEMRSLLFPKSNPRFQFYIQDDDWVVTLAKDFLALETSKYTRWEEFRDLAEMALKALSEVYEPAYFTRIGLRYRNVIDRKRLGLGDVEWRTLIQDFVLGHLARTETSGSIMEQHSKYLLKLNDVGDFVRMEYGQVTYATRDPDHLLYLLDHDFFSNEKMEMNDVINRLAAYNSLNGRLFHWCIKKSLHDAMGPESS